MLLIHSVPTGGRKIQEEPGELEKRISFYRMKLIVCV